MEWGWGGLGIRHVFTDSIIFKQQIHGSFLQMGGAWVGGGGLTTSYFMIPNIKTYFDKKVTFLALVPSLLLNMYV